MDLLEFLLELASWLFEAADLARFWRFFSVLALGIALGVWIAGKIPKRALGRLAAAPVVLVAGALGLTWERRS